MFFMIFPINHSPFHRFLIVFPMTSWPFSGLGVRRSSLFLGSQLNAGFDSKAERPGGVSLSRKKRVAQELDDLQ